MRIGWWEPTSSDRPLSCEYTVQLLSLELDDEISETELAALGRHLAGCAGCRARREELHALTTALRATPLVEAARPVWVPVPRRRRLRTRPAGALAGLAVAAAAVAAGVFALQPPATQPSALTFSSHGEQQRYAAVQHKRVEPMPTNVVPALPLSWIPLSLLR